MVFAHCWQLYKCPLIWLLCFDLTVYIFIFMCVYINVYLNIFSVLLCLHVYVLLILRYTVCIYKSIKYFQKDIHIMSLYMIHYNMTVLYIFQYMYNKKKSWHNFFLNIFIAGLVFHFSYCILLWFFNYLTSIYSLTFSVIFLSISVLVLWHIALLICLLLRTWYTLKSLVGGFMCCNQHQVIEEYMVIVVLFQ